MANNKHRKQHLKYDCYYDLWVHNADKDNRHVCHYCGNVANALDHVPPISRIESIVNCDDFQHIQPVKIPSCSRCNGWLGDKWRVDYQESKNLLLEHAAKKLEKKRVTEWDQEEVKELGRNLKGYVREMLDETRWYVDVVNFDLDVSLLAFHD